MENRSNTYLVGGVLAVLLLALIAYIYWASPGAGKRSRPYDVFFEKSVAGLLENSPVTFQGVAIGKVGRISFDAANPELVQVRMQITNPDVPILEGTTAAIDRDVFGVAIITLDAGPAGAPPIRATKWNEVPVIPVKKGGLALEDPASVIENISMTADRLNRFLTPDNQRTISDEIARMERRSRILAEKAPHFADSIARTRASIREGGAMAEAMGHEADAFSRKLQSRRGSTEALRASLSEARTSMEQFDASVNAARPTVAKLSGNAIGDQVKALRESTEGLGKAVQQIDRAGAGSLTSKPVLPDYEAAH